MSRNFGSIPAPTISQLQSETATWKRLLSFLMEENIYLKHRIAEILKEESSTRLLAKPETFQASFIYTDALVSLLRDDVVQFKKKLETEGINERLVNKNFAGRLQRIRRNISAAERTFNQRQTAFNNYLSENI